ncbi:uncharacterized protein LY79DRAFT_336358 [Colletotrichum navitas]|uniref:Secreted protein n=1 Tax=Colletotrichum navitas TaxID=681940 RepID=A0AAD8PT14_9PEZI|nr:uncharacterized protein LY79DRAFT_336358 [Colletotrichum navitas]KAK1579675.1 hypothetical protein LY79DRAFT_336358 [Colletotrichum navitas]
MPNIGLSLSVFLLSSPLLSTLSLSLSPSRSYQTNPTTHSPSLDHSLPPAHATDRVKWPGRSKATPAQRYCPLGST